MLACAWSVQHQISEGRIPADCLSLFVPSNIAPTQITSHLEAFESLDRTCLWTVIEPLCADRYERMGRLADLAKRLIVSAASPADVVFVPHVWRVVRTGQSATVQPTENYVLFRTIADLLGSARFACTMYIGRTAQCYVFDRGGQAVLALWDDHAPSQGRPFTVYLGSEAKHVDLWGNELPIELAHRREPSEAASAGAYPPSRIALAGGDSSYSSRPETLFAQRRSEGARNKRHERPATRTEDQCVDSAGDGAGMGLALAPRRVYIGRVPTLITGAPTWLMRLRSSFVLDPARIEAHAGVHPVRIRFANRAAEPISGTVRLLAPDGWDVRPARFDFAVAPGQSFDRTLSLRFPYNEATGAKSLTAGVVVGAGRQYHLVVPVPFTLGLGDISVHSLAQVDGERVIIRQSVSNRSNRSASFEGFVRAPPWPPQRRLIANLRPAETVVKEYVLEQAGRLAGREVRVGLKEIGGAGRLLNQVVLVP